MCADLYVCMHLYVCVYPRYHKCYEFSTCFVCASLISASVRVARGASLASRLIVSSSFDRCGWLSTAVAVYMCGSVKMLSAVAILANWLTRFPASKSTFHRLSVLVMFSCTDLTPWIDAAWDVIRPRARLWRAWLPKLVSVINGRGHLQFGGRYALGGAGTSQSPYAVVACDWAKRSIVD